MNGDTPGYCSSRTGDGSCELCSEVRAGLRQAGRRKGEESKGMNAERKRAPRVRVVVVAHIPIPSLPFHATPLPLLLAGNRCVCVERVQQAPRRVPAHRAHCDNRQALRQRDLVCAGGIHEHRCNAHIRPALQLRPPRVRRHHHHSCWWRGAIAGVNRRRNRRGVGVCRGRAACGRCAVRRRCWRHYPQASHARRSRAGQNVRLHRQWKRRRCRSRWGL